MSWFEIVAYCGICRWRDRLYSNLSSVGDGQYYGAGPGPEHNFASSYDSLVRFMSA